MGRYGIVLIGGESGIRTHDELAPIPVFETGAFVRSAISPLRATRNYSIVASPTYIEVRSHETISQIPSPLTGEG